MPRARALHPGDPLWQPALSDNGYPHMVLDHYVARIREMRRERRARLAALKSRRDALRYQERVKTVIARAFSPRPAKTPLNARVTGTLEFKTGRVEKIIFESRPGCLVTGNLYIPHGCDADHPLPCVLGLCGHAAEGKASKVYQGFPQRLAAAGFVTFIIDPFSQGERDQYRSLPAKLRDSLGCDHCCEAHNMMGKQLELVGEYFGLWRAWDGIRALDYLLARSEADPRHIGLTGNSGGGTMSTWLWGCEDRFTMAAPSCFVTTFASNLENELPADCEQYPPGVLGAGLEMTDFIISGAPKPSLLLGQALDFFDRRGLKEAHAEVARFYALLGAPAQSHELFIGPMGHGFSWHNQQRMVSFFARRAHGARQPRQLSDKQVQDLGEKNLFATPHGHVILAGGRPIYEFSAELARRQTAARNRLSNGRLIQAVRKVLNLDAQAGTSAGERKPPHYRALGPHLYGGNKSRLTCFAVETEYASGPDDARAVIRAMLWQPRPTYGFGIDLEPRVTLYLPHVSAEAELCEKKLAGALIPRVGKLNIVALDPRGLGASRAVMRGQEFFAPYGFDYMHHGHGILFGESFLGRRVFDVLRALDLLASCGVREVDLVGRGQGALLAAYAALLSSRVRSATLLGAPRSYLEWAVTPVVRWPAANYPRGVLKSFDLPDVYRALGRRLKHIEYWDAFMRPAKKAARKSIPLLFRKKSAE